MANVIDILETLESDGSRNAKGGVMEANRDNALLHRFFSLAFDPWKNWGVAKYDKVDFFGSHGHGDVMLNTFMDLLDDLNDRKMTGSRARGAVEGSVVLGVVLF